MIQIQPRRADRQEMQGRPARIIHSLIPLVFSLLGVLQCSDSFCYDEALDPSCPSREIYPGQESKILVNEKEFGGSFLDSPCSIAAFQTGAQCEVHLSLSSVTNWTSTADLGFGVLAKISKEGRYVSVQKEDMDCDIRVDGDEKVCGSYQGEYLFGCSKLPTGAQEVILRCSAPPTSVRLYATLRRYDCPSKARCVTRE